VRRFGINAAVAVRGGTPTVNAVCESGNDNNNKK
jgi:hypothetical protein